ncbi:hypothetical protein [Rhodopirellula europaea]|uniref:hypothetical protein n=1 Tax=Rhodopirellula europaea TaxID=1263866 RepID=UPI003D26A6B7
MYLFRRKLVCSVVVLWLFTHQALGDDTEVSSIGEAYCANWLAVTSYDVLMTVSEFRISDRGDSMERVTSHRQIVDHENETFWMGSRTEVEQLSAAGVSVKRHLMSVSCYDGRTGEEWMKSSGRNAMRLAGDDFLKALHRSREPDPRWTGVLVAEYAYAGKTLEESFSTNYSPTKEFRLHSRTGMTVDLSVKVPVSPGISHVIELVRFDTNRWVPTMLTQTFFLRERSEPRLREVYEWEEREGIYLPVKVRGEHNMNVMSGGERSETPLVYDVDFQWLSVNNGKKDREKWSVGLMSDSERVLKMLDPQDAEGVKDAER